MEEPKPSKWKLAWQGYMGRNGNRIFPAFSKLLSRSNQPAVVARVSTSGVFRLTSNDDMANLSLSGEMTKVHELRGEFDTSFARILKPLIHPNERAEITALAFSSCGKYVVAGSNIYRFQWITPGTPGSSVDHINGSSGEHKIKQEMLVAGGLHVWEQEHNKWLPWQSCLNTEALQNLPPVTSLSLSGQCLVTGHYKLQTASQNGSSSALLSAVSALARTHGEVHIWKFDREGMQLELMSKVGRHHSPVTSLVVLRPRTRNTTWLEELRLTTVTQDGDIRVWSGAVGNLELSATLPGHTDKVACLAYLPASRTEGENHHSNWGELLASASNDKTVRIWSLDTNREVHVLRHTREVYSVAFQSTIGSRQDGVLCVTASHDQKTRVWNVASGICVQSLHLHISPVMSVAFQPKGEMVASGCQGHSVILADTRSGLKMRTMLGHTAFITAVGFLPTTDLVVSGSLDGTIRLWEVKSSENAVVELGVKRDTMPSEAHDKTVYSVGFSPDSGILATASRDHTIKLWDTATLDCRHTLVGHKNFVFSVIFHPNGRIVASASHDASIGLWDARSGELKQMLSQANGKYSPSLHSDEVSDVAFHPNGNMMASGSYDKSVIIYTNKDPEAFLADPANNKWVPRFSLQHHTARVWTLAFSRCGTWLVTGAWDSTVHIYDTATFELSSDEFMPAQTPARYSLNCFANVWTAEFQPNVHKEGYILATGAADNKVRIWSNRADNENHLWQIESVLEGHGNTVTGLAWHPDGHMLVSSSFDRTVRLWGRLKDGSDPFRFQSYGVWSAYGCPTMAVAWADKRMDGCHSVGASMISVATMNSPTFIMDATDAGQKFITCSRATHTLSQGAATWDILLDMVKEFPETLTSLGGNSGLLLHRIISDCDDQRLLRRFLDLSKKMQITPLLPYGPRGKPLLAAVNSYHSAAAVVDSVIEMGELGAQVGAACLASGTGTCLILMLIENFPDQAVRLLLHVGMARSHDIVYKKGWNRRMMLSMDGMVVQPASDESVGETRYPSELWSEKQGERGFFSRLFGLKQGFGEEEEVMIDVVAVHSSFPHACGMLPHKYAWGSSDGSGDMEMDYCSLSRSFLHLSYNCGEPRLFDTPLGRAVLQYKWEAFGRKFAATQFLVFVAHLSLVVAQSIALGRLQGAGGWLDRDDHDRWILTSLILGGSVVFFSLVQAAYEFCQIMAQSPSNYLTDPWNVLDLCVIFVCATSGVAVIAMQTWSPYVVAVAAFFAWLKVFYFMRAFTATGGLVRMVMQIGYDMRHLLLLLVVVIMAAATSFHVLLPGAWAKCAEMSSDYLWWHYGEYQAYCSLGNDQVVVPDSSKPDMVEDMEKYYEGLPWPGDDEKEFYPPALWDVLLRVYGMMLGDFKLIWFGKVPYPAVGQVLWIIFMFLEMVLLLNLLIALMGDSYEKVQEKSKIEALRERAGLLVEMEMVIEYLFGDKYLLKHNFCPRWLHAVMPKEAIQNGDGPGRAREWSGIAGTIKADLESSVSLLRIQMKEEMERLHDSLSREVQEKMRLLMQNINDALSNAARAQANQGARVGTPSS